MKSKLLLVFLLGIFTSCETEAIEPKEPEPVVLRTNDTITVADLSADPAGTSPARGPYNVLGHGYDITGEYADSSAARLQVIDLVKLEEDMPTRVMHSYPYSNGSIFAPAENAEILSRMLSAGTEVTRGSRSFKAAITSYFPNEDALSDKYIYGVHTQSMYLSRFELNATSLLLKDYLTAGFKVDVQNTTPQDVVEKYGTHVLNDILLGTKLMVVYRAETEYPDRERAAEIGLRQALLIVFKNLGHHVYTHVEVTTVNFSQELRFKVSGGPRLLPTSSPYSPHPVIDLSGWYDSLTPEIQAFIDFGPSVDALIPLYELIEDPLKKEEIKKYIEAYLSENEVRL